MSELLLTCRKCGSAEGSRVCERCRRLRTYDPRTHRAISVEGLEALRYRMEVHLMGRIKNHHNAPGFATLAEARSLLEEQDDE